MRQRRSSDYLLHDINLSVDSGEVVGLVGESGAGKSMITRAVLDLLPTQARVTRGEIHYDDLPLLRHKKRHNHQLIGSKIALIPQDPMGSLNPVRTIGHQMIDLIRLHLPQSALDARREAKKLLDEVAIRDSDRVLDAYAHELSGGMRQRVLIAMAFSVRPRLIIADEPTTALDVTVQKTVLALIKNLQQKYETSVLFVTHDLGIVAKLCDRIVVLFNGSVVEATTVQASMQSSAHPYTQALYKATLRYDQPDKAIHPIPENIVEALRQNRPGRK